MSVIKKIYPNKHIVHVPQNYQCFGCVGLGGSIIESTLNNKPPSTSPHPNQSPSPSCPSLSSSTPPHPDKSPPQPHSNRSPSTSPHTNQSPFSSWLSRPHSSPLHPNPGPTMPQPTCFHPRYTPTFLPPLTPHLVHHHRKESMLAHT